MKSILRVALLLFIVIIGFAAIAIYWTFLKPLPKYNTTAQIPELTQEVTIYWDDFGIPHIFATNEDDLYTSLGYVHARDRLWQMTVTQLFVEGRIAEFLGNDALDIDKYSRTIGFWRIAGELESNLDHRELSILQAYSDGVNRYVTDNRKSLPIEFALTGTTPLLWTPRHTIALSRVLAWELNVSWWSKMMLGQLESKLPNDMLQELFPRWEPGAPRNLDERLTRELLGSMDAFWNTELAVRKLMSAEGSHVGSNAWVASGAKTTTGRPLLAGDPHLGLDMPGKWYEVHLNLNGRNVSGATIAGAPLVILGQSDHHAWSFTSLMSDDTDFFVEKVHPEDPNLYLSDSTETRLEYRPFRTVKELILTNEGDEILHEVRYTQNGPIINDVYQNRDIMNNKLISMRWSGFEHSNEIKALIDMSWARNMQEFKQSLDAFGVPGLNIIYADTAGNIAMFTAANLPIRTNPSLLFRNGADAGERWNQFIPRNQLPRIVNPESGYIANANNPVVSENYPYYITAFWEPDSRIRRIEEVMQNNPTHTSQLYRELQNDVFSYQARDITGIILPVLQQSDLHTIQRALPYLQNWDFRYVHSATAATLLDMFFINFVENLFREEMGDAFYRNFIKMENMPVRVTTHMLKYGSTWLKTDSGDTNYRDSLIVASMHQTVRALELSHGSSASEWRWENLHTVTFRPPLFYEASLDENAPNALKMIVKNVLSRGPFAVPGHSMTVNNTQYSWEKPYEQTLGASIRRIVDLSDMSQSESVLPTGQSGNPLERHFGDQTELWLSGKYRIFQHNNNIPERTQSRIMTLRPK
jgi:penicillin G amidase